MRLFEGIDSYRALSVLVHDKASAVEFLQYHGLLHAPRKCANGHDMTLSLSKKNDRWRCRKGKCRTEVGLRVGTWFEGTKLSLDTWVHFCYWWSKEKTSIKFCKEELELSSECIVDNNNYLREVCAQVLLASPACIGGPRLTVEIDESVFSKRKYNVGRQLPHQWVFGGVCRETKECFLYAVENRTRETLEAVIKESIAAGSHIMSDGWASYGRISEIEDENGEPMYTHSVVNHSENFVNPEDGTHTNTIESTWNVAKAGNRRRWGTHRSMLDSYLCEFMWRRRLGDEKAFDKILRDIVKQNPLSV